VSATIFAGVEGASYNMYQDTAVFLGIASGLLLRQMRMMASSGAPRRILRELGSAAALLVFVTPILVKAAAALPYALQIERQVQANREAERSFLADAAFIAGRKGAAICESMLLCYYAGQPFLLDPFNSRQSILAGKLDEADFVNRIAAHEFAAVQLRGDVREERSSAASGASGQPQAIRRFTDGVLDAIDRYYRIERRSQIGVFYVPR